MSIEKTIQDCLSYLIDSHKESKEWYGEGFLEGSDFALLRTLTKRHYNQWTAKMAYNGWEILSKYKEELEDNDVTFKDIEKPDYIPEDKITKNDFNIVNIIQNRFEINNPCSEMKKTFKSNEQTLKIDFNLDSLYKILPFIRENKIKINKQYFKFINMFLNVLKTDDMFVGFNKNDFKKFKFNLKPFQAIGCLYMLINKRVLLGDEMGLGKTLQALSSVELSNKKPCLIVCPNSLKLNWEKEIRENFKDQKIEILGKNPDPKADYYIINYESLHKYLEFLDSIKAKSVILDESLYVKNQKTKRTTSCLKAVKNIEYRFALTGTAILKSPVDIISQLKVLNRLDYFGCENTFIEKFCGNSKTQWGRDLRKGSSNLNVLNKELRESCFLRRDKEQVTRDLPEKSRSYVYLDTASKKYKKHMSDFSKLPKREKLDKIEFLRNMAAEEKLEGSKEWIDNFLQTEKKLVVFAYHKNIQKELIKNYPEAAAITSEMSPVERDRNVRLFMENENCKLIICSLKAASVGLTLTASSDVLFVEMDWCAATNNQAEDRCHRIGQKNNVNIWYLISKGTIEEHILNIANTKRKLFDKVYNSELTLEDNQNILDNTSLIDEIILEIERKKENSVLQKTG